MSEMVEKVARATAANCWGYEPVEADGPAKLNDFQECVDCIEEGIRNAIAATPLEKYRQALESIRDIEKPMCGEHPETDWLSWYITSSQQEEIACAALRNAAPSLIAEIKRLREELAATVSQRDEWQAIATRTTAMTWGSNPSHDELEEQENIETIQRLRAQRDEAVKLLRTARNQAVGFALDSLNHAEAVQTVEYIDSFLASLEGK